MWGSKLYMRPQDHQADPGRAYPCAHGRRLTFDYDNSGFGRCAKAPSTMAAMDSPTTCEMKRP